MFINFRILIRSNQAEIVELITTTPKEASNLVSLFERDIEVVAWQMTTHRPQEFGWAQDTSASWKKLRLNGTGFTKEDYQKANNY